MFRERSHAEWFLQSRDLLAESSGGLLNSLYTHVIHGPVFPGSRRQGKSSLGLNPEGGREAPLTIAPINYTTELLFAETRGPVFSICIRWSLAVSTPTSFRVRWFARIAQAGFPEAGTFTKSLTGCIPNSWRRVH